MSITPDATDPTQNGKNDAAWLSDLKALPRAKLVRDHIDGVSTMTTSHGFRGSESSFEQASNWRRAFCHQLSKTKAAFGLSATPSRSLPRMIAICNLSGKYGIFQSERYTLAKVMCGAHYLKNTQIHAGVTAVIRRAEELDCSVLLCLCLPFQAGIDRMFWELRTIRLADGRVIDGELGFSIHDEQARPMPTTQSVEHWSANVLTVVSKALSDRATAVSLDRGDEEMSNEHSREQLQGIVEMLKADRKRLIAKHDADEAILNQRNKARLAEALDRADSAEVDANVRVSKLAAVHKIAEETAVAKRKTLEDHNAELQKKLSAQKAEALEAKALLNGIRLEHEQDAKAATARQKTLESQVGGMRSSHAKQVAESTRVMREQTNAHKKITDELRALVDDLKAKLAASNAACNAIQASANEAFNDVQRLRDEKDAIVAELRTRRSVSKVNRAVAALAACRLREEQERAAVAAGPPPPPPSPPSEAETSEAAVEASPPEAPPEAPPLQTTAAEPSPPPRAAALQTALTQAVEQGTRMKATIKELQRKLDELTAKYSKEATESLSPEKPAVSFNQNTAVFVNSGNGVPHAAGYAPGYSAQQQQHYQMNQALEQTISQVHSALNCLTSMARASDGNARRADALQSKMEMIYAQPLPHYGYGGY